MFRMNGVECPGSVQSTSPVFAFIARISSFHPPTRRCSPSGALGQRIAVDVAAVHRDGWIDARRRREEREGHADRDERRDRRDDAERPPDPSPLHSDGDVASINAPCSQP
jgi:hypothetical protein